MVPRSTSRVLIASALLLLWLHVLLILTLNDQHSRALASDLLQLGACASVVALTVPLTRPDHCTSTVAPETGCPSAVRSVT